MGKHDILVTLDFLHTHSSIYNNKDRQDSMLKKEGGYTITPDIDSLKIQPGETHMMS